MKLNWIFFSSLFHLYFFPSRFKKIQLDKMIQSRKIEEEEEEGREKEDMQEDILVTN